MDVRQSNNGVPPGADGQPAEELQEGEEQQQQQGMPATGDYEAAPGESYEAGQAQDQQYGDGQGQVQYDENGQPIGYGDPQGGHAEYPDPSGAEQQQPQDGYDQQQQGEYQDPQHPQDAHDQQNHQDGGYAEQPGDQAGHEGHDQPLPDVDHAPEHHEDKPKKGGIPKPQPGSKSPGRSRNASASPSRIPQGGHADGGDGKPPQWNSYTYKKDDVSLKLKSSPEASPSRIRGAANVSSPTREERLKRKKWAEEAQRRAHERAMRALEEEKRTKEEAEARLEARKQAVRLRIEQEKEKLAAVDSKKASSGASSPKRRPAPLKLPPLDKPGSSDQALNGRGRSMSRSQRQPSQPRRRSASPGGHQYYHLKLQQEFEARQAREEEEMRQKLDEMRRLKNVRVKALMDGEVIVRPLPGEGAEAIKQREPPPRWNPAGRFNRSPSPTRRDGARERRSMSPRRSQEGGDEGEPGSPSGEGGPVLYSTGLEDSGGRSDRLPPGATNGGGGRGHLVKRSHGGGAGGGHGRSGRFSRHLAMMDRASSPFILDSGGNPLNAPSQEQFWPSTHGEPHPPSKQPSKVGALSQDPPPPPASRLHSRQGSHAGAHPDHRTSNASKAHGHGHGQDGAHPEAGGLAPVLEATQEGTNADQSMDFGELGEDNATVLEVNEQELNAAIGEEASQARMEHHHGGDQPQDDPHAQYHPDDGGQVHEEGAAQPEYDGQHEQAGYGEGQGHVEGGEQGQVEGEEGKQEEEQQQEGGAGTKADD